MSSSFKRLFSLPCLICWASCLPPPAHRVTAAQMSLAIIIGLLCTGLNIWLIYKKRQTGDPSKETGQSIQSRQNTLDTSVSASLTGTQRSRKVSVSPAGFDNPNWVYGENGSSSSSQGVLLHPEPENRRPISVSVISDGGGTMRYATIRRAPSILMTLPPEHHHYAPPRIHLKSASFRFGGERDPQVLRQSRSGVRVNRSKTMRETSFTTSSPCNIKSFETTQTFAQRFQSSLEGTSALSFVHDISGEEEEEEATGGISVASTAPVADSPVAAETPPPKTPIRSTKKENGMQTIEADVLQEEEDESPAQLPPVRQQVRSSDRIILRVESFRTMNSSGSPVRTPTAPTPPGVMRVQRNNVKRVSSSTQTELSVLKANPLNSTGQPQRNKRPVPHHTQYQGPKVKASGAVASQTTGTATLPHISPVESSSGYSSPRGTESKSPTPEPTHSQHQDVQVATTTTMTSPSPANVTVIQIDPKPVSKKEPRVTDVTYATPRKRSERGTPTGNESTPTPEMGFQVSIQSKPVSRSVSFHHMSQAGRRAVYGNEWLNAGSLIGNHLPPLVMSIPRPALRSQQQRMTPPSSSPRRNSHGVNHLPPSGSSLSRSTSMYLAMSEIQRKLDLLQVLGTRHHLPMPNGDVVPVHREHHHNPQDEYYYSASPSHSEGSRRSRSRPNTRQQQPPPPPPPPPPAPPLPSVDLNDSMDSAKTLAYLSELEMLARHWRTQLLYKVIILIVYFE